MAGRAAQADHDPGVLHPATGVEEAGPDGAHLGEDRLGEQGG